MTQAYTADSLSPDARKVFNWIARTHLDECLTVTKICRSHCLNGSSYSLYQPAIAELMDHGLISTSHDQWHKPKPGMCSAEISVLDAGRAQAQSYLKEKESWLYRFYNSEGELLYVGVTENFDRRFKEHRSSKDWWPEVSDVRLSRSNLCDVRAAEQHAIVSERPLHNVMHNVA